MAGESVLTVRGATARYGATRALDNVDLDVAAGELCALLGPNAAGKTTALRVIIGRVPLEHGTIRVLGRDPLTDIGARTRIGLVPQEIALYGHLTVRENLEVFARLAGVAPRQVPERMAAALAMCRLGTRANDQVRSLSGGLKRLANIACAILHQPRLLILDEPTVGVDIDAQGAVNASLVELRERGMAIIMTTHDLDQAEAIATHAVFLVRGAVAGAGRPDDLIAAEFGSDHEIVVTLRNEPGASERGLLESLGLRPTRVPTVWSTLTAPDAAASAQMAATLRGNGLRLREVRLREPDLASLFVRFTGEPAPS